MNLELKKKFCLFYSKLENLTAKKNIVTKILNEIILSSAKLLKCNLFMIDHSKNDFASEILNDIVLGQKIYATFLKLSVPKNLKFFFPLTIFSDEEIVILAHCLDTLKFKSITLKKNNLNLCLHQITKKCLFSLKSNCAPTTRNICKLGDKLKCTTCIEVSLKKCILCNEFKESKRTMFNEISTQFAKYISWSIIKTKRVIDLERKILSTHINKNILENIALFECFLTDIQFKSSNSDFNNAYICYSCFIIYENS